MLTVPTAPAGTDPDCGFAQAQPDWHHCTTNQGEPVTGAKSCFAWARHCLAAQTPKCPACARPVYQNAEPVRLARYTANPPAVVVDPTWRHHEDGTVAVMPDGAPSCLAVAS